MEDQLRDGGGNNLHVNELLLCNNIVSGGRRGGGGGGGGEEPLLSRLPLSPRLHPGPAGFSPGPPEVRCRVTELIATTGEASSSEGQNKNNHFPINE